MSLVGLNYAAAHPQQSSYPRPRRVLRIPSTSSYGIADAVQLSRTADEDEYRLVCSLVGIFIFMKILSRLKFKDTIFIPLVGLMFGGIVNSATTFFAYKYNLIQGMSAWLYGDFSMIMLTLMSKSVRFYFVVELVVLFAGLLYQMLFRREGRSIYHLLLNRLVCGSFFSSATSFWQKLIDVLLAA